MDPHPTLPQQRLAGEHASVSYAVNGQLLQDSISLCLTRPTCRSQIVDALSYIGAISNLPSPQLPFQERDALCLANHHCWPILK